MTVSPFVRTITSIDEHVPHAKDGPYVGLPCCRKKTRDCSCRAKVAASDWVSGREWPRHRLTQGSEVAMH